MVQLVEVIIVRASKENTVTLEVRMGITKRSEKTETSTHFRVVTYGQSTVSTIICNKSRITEHRKNRPIS